MKRQQILVSPDQIGWLLFNHWMVGSSFLIVYNGWWFYTIASQPTFFFNVSCLLNPCIRVYIVSIRELPLDSTIIHRRPKRARYRFPRISIIRLFKWYSDSVCIWEIISWKLCSLAKNGRRLATSNWFE